MSEVKQAKLKERLTYDPLTGVFQSVSGGPIGIRDRKGYLRIHFMRAQYLAARLAWLYMTGYLPEPYEVDHADRDKTNDRWANLRLATKSQNMQNRLMTRSVNPDLPRGVARRCQKFAAYIRIGGKNTYLGVYTTPDLAHEAYMTKAREVYGEYVPAA